MEESYKEIIKAHIERAFNGMIVDFDGQLKSDGTYDYTAEVFSRIMNKTYKVSGFVGSLGSIHLRFDVGGDFVFIEV